ncbi:MAG: SDR family oxidoreductase [Bacteroidota bacterium]
MKIFVTGGTGYLGNKLVAELSASGNEVNAICHNPSKNKFLQYPGVNIFEGDTRDPASMKKAMQGCTQVYHLAGYARVWSKDPANYYTINVGGTKNILDTAIECGIDKVVYTSTAGVLGPSRENPVKETDKRIGKILNEYEDSKTQAENLCIEYAQKKGLNVTIVNPPRVYGPGLSSESNGLSNMIKQYLENNWRIIPGDGEGIGSYVYIDDIIRGHILAMEKGRPGERYILSGENATYNEFFKTLAKVSGIKKNLIKLPLPIMLFAGQLMLFKTKLTGKPPLLTPKWIKKYTDNWALDCEKAKNELGYSYISLEEGFKKTLEWIKENKELQ